MRSGGDNLARRAKAADPARQLPGRPNEASG